MKKISLVLALVTISAAPAWAGGSNHHPGSSQKTAWVQKVQALQNGGKVSHHCSPELNHKPIKSQPITSRDLVPNRPYNMLKGSESANNHLPVAVSNPIPTRPGFVWAGDHWERARVTAGSVATGSPPPLNSSSGFSSLANNPPPVVLTPVTNAPKPGRPSGGHDYHASKPNGGVTVTIIPGSQRPSDVTGVGDSPIDNFFQSFGTPFTPGTLPSPPIRDQRIPAPMRPLPRN